LAEAVAVAGASGSVTSVVDRISDFLGKIVDKVIEIYSDPLKGTLISIGLVKLTGLISIDPNQIGRDLDKVADQLDGFDPSSLLGPAPSFDITQIFETARKTLGL
jgi:hypothetical protein